MEVSDHTGNVGLDEIPVRVDIRAPVLTIEPLNGTAWSTLLRITLSFSDEISGVDVSALQVRLNGIDIRGRFQVENGKATYTPTAWELAEALQVIAENRLTLEVSPKDNVENLARVSATWSLDAEAVRRRDVPVRAIRLERISRQYQEGLVNRCAKYGIKTQAKCIVTGDPW